MKIVRITLGVLEAGAPAVYLLEPHPKGLTVAATGALPADEIAAAVRHTLCRAEPRRSARLPFIRIALEAGELDLEVADDSSQSIRMLTEGRRGALPLVMEASAGDDAQLEALLARISAAAGLESAEQLGLALALGVQTRAGGEATEDELAFVEAEQRATQLAAAVRGIDDRMTASVVPDWIWIATGFGGLGVALTAIVFLYPEARIYLIPALIVLSVIGFGLYGLSSWKELSLRGRLQIERSEVRARREAAREDARRRRAALEVSGRNPDALMVRLHGMVIPKHVPAVLSEGADLSALEDVSDRQAIVFVTGESPHPRRRDLSRSTVE